MRNIFPCNLLKIYLQGRTSVQGPLFCHLDGKTLTRFQFLSVLKKALNWAGISDKGFSSHSLPWKVFLKIQYKLNKEKKTQPFRISEVKICFISLCIPCMH
jgi:hypothetical protein